MTTRKEEAICMITKINRPYERLNPVESAKPTGDVVLGLAEGRVKIVDVSAISTNLPKYINAV
jgi:hypothetical protein